MPIDRPDGRHFCDPGSQQPGPGGTWTCPGCKTQWTYISDQHVWVSAADLPKALAKQAVLAEQAADYGKG